MFGATSTQVLQVSRLCGVCCVNCTLATLVTLAGCVAPCGWGHWRCVSIALIVTRAMPYSHIGM